MATVSYGVIPYGSSNAVKQVGEKKQYQYQSNGYLTANWTYSEIIDSTQVGSILSPGARLSGYTLYTAETEVLNAGLARVDYVWVYQPTVVPPTAYSMQGAVQEQSIVLNPQFAASMASTWDYQKGQFQPTSPFYGRTAYKSPVCSVFVTSYSTSEPDLTMDSMPIGKLQVPGGGFSGDYTHWLCETYTFQLQGNLWITNASYLYNGDGYNTTIYQEA